MKPYIITFLLILVVFIGYSPLFGWPTVNGVGICLDPYNQQDQQLINDGTGGAIIVWDDGRNRTDFDIYVQRISKYGINLWVNDGQVICNSTSNQLYPQIVTDGAGGAIMTWQDHRGGNNFDIYAQRVNSIGSTLWKLNGISICTAINDQEYPMIVSDGVGGAIIVWQDYRNGSNADIYAQRILSNGSTLWTVNGIAICTVFGNKIFPVLISDDSSGAIINWQDGRRGVYDTYIQRVSKTGSLIWSSTGIPIGQDVYISPEHPKMISDNKGGAILAWINTRNSIQGIYSQRVNSQGSTLWSNNGISICTECGCGDYPNVTTDNGNGAIITWENYLSSTSNAIFAQHVTNVGSTLWKINGVQLCTTMNYQRYPKSISDENGGAIITWMTWGGIDHIYAQRIDKQGDLLWPLNGLSLCNIPKNQSYPQIVPDGSGGSIISWRDGRFGFSNIFAQQIYSNGQIAPPTTIPKGVWELYSE